MSKPRNRLAAMLREPVTVAIFTAVLVTSVLAFAVLAIWTGAPGANGPDGGPAVELAGTTPTPRAINWPGSPPPATPPATSQRPRRAPAVANVPAINPVPADTPAPRPTLAPIPAVEPEPTAESTPSPPPAPTATPAPTPAAPPSPTPEPDFEATDAGSFAPLVAGRWTVAGGTLINDSPQALSEPWLQVPHPIETGDFAIEAEIKVDGLAPGVCNQSFGVIAGSELTGQFWGGGVIYGCGSTIPAARITDVSNWTDGYDQDRQLARGGFDPDEEWHQYRLEVRGNELRLLIDGEELLTATESAVPGGLSAGQVGLWTQGVRLTIRRVAIFTF